MRPVGGAIFGWLGDTVGRKTALEISIVLMLIPSVTIALLPGFSSLGAGATALLVVLRLCQGIAVGGELVTAFVFVAEQAPSRRSAPFWTALVLGGSNCGTLLGIGVVAVVRNSMSRSALYRYGWRLCFALGLPLGLVGVVLRRGIHGAEEPEELANASHNPLARVWRSKRREVVCVAGVVSLWCGGFYSAHIWMGIYFSERIGGLKPIKHGYAVNAGMLAVLCILFVPYAHHARAAPSLPTDANARQALLRGQLGVAIVSLPAFGLLAVSRTQLAAVLAQFAFALSLASFGAGMPYFLVATFPPHIRVAAIGIAYNIAQALFGGTAPVVMTALARIHPVLPGLGLALLAIVSHASLRALDALKNTVQHQEHVSLEFAQTGKDDGERNDNQHEHKKSAMGSSAIQTGFDQCTEERDPQYDDRDSPNNLISSPTPVSSSPKPAFPPQAPTPAPASMKCIDRRVGPTTATSSLHRDLPRDKLVDSTSRTAEFV